MTASTTSNFPYLGYGLGLRSEHFKHVLHHPTRIDWFEIISENYLDTKAWPYQAVRQVAEKYPIVMHGVSMSIGSTDPINTEYLKKLKTLAKELKAAWISDHLCWTGVLGRNTHDLLPLPLNEETLNHVVERIRVVQDILEQPVVLENPSSYLQFNQDTFTEYDFIREMAEASDCRLLLDINNVYVSAFNHHYDAETYIKSLPLQRVVQFHLAGHTNLGSHIIDTHDNHVINEVWKLYRYTIGLTGQVSTLLEWDANLPAFSILEDEVLKAKHILTTGLLPPPATLNVTTTTVSNALHLQSYTNNQ